jgi:hypothetical protein
LCCRWFTPGSRVPAAAANGNAIRTAETTMVFVDSMSLSLIKSTPPSAGAAPPFRWSVAVP